MKTKNIPHLAVQALIEEVMVHPKPGLVDPVSHGAHPDMDVFTFISSALSLEPYFIDITNLAIKFSQKDLRVLFSQIRKLGMKAEKTMFQATRGINTHKGAIFSLGILVTATSYELSHRSTLTLLGIQNTIKKMLLGLTVHDFLNIKEKPKEKLTAGEKEYLKYGLTGIRGQAESGFPIVFNYSFPFLKSTNITDRNSQLVDTLMVIVQHIKDSNLVKRADQLSVLSWIKEQAQIYFKLGASQTVGGNNFLKKLDLIFTDCHLSLGGSADLLILTIFLDLVFDSYYLSIRMN